MSILSPADRSLERRAARRCACQVATCCHLITHASSCDRWQATMVDLSTSGLGLILRRRFEKGSLLVVETLDEDEQPVNLIHCRVVRLSERADGSWLLGCTLAKPLAAQDIQGIVETAPERVRVGPPSFVPRNRAEAALLLKRLRAQREAV